MEFEPYNNTVQPKLCMQTANQQEKNIVQCWACYRFRKHDNKFMTKEKEKGGKKLRIGMVRYVGARPVLRAPEPARLIPVKLEQSPVYLLVNLIHPKLAG